MTMLPTRSCFRPGQRRSSPTRALRAVAQMLLLAVVIDFAASRVAAQTATWTGAAGNSSWSNSLNWVGSTAPDAAYLQFGAVTGVGVLTPTTVLNNDVSPTHTYYGDITFMAGAAAYTLTGNVISIDAYGTTQSITNNTVNVTQTLNLPIALQKSATVNAAAGNVAIGGVISGTNNLTKTGANTLILSGANTFTGSLLVSNGTVRAAGNAGALGVNGSNFLTLAGGRLELANDSGLAFNRNTVISNSTSIASDRLTAGAGVTHTLGTLSIGAQTLSVGKGSAVTSGIAGLTFGAVTLSAGGGVFETASGAQLTLASVAGTNTGFTVQGAGTTLISGAIATGSGTLAKNGTGALTLTGANAFTGATTIAGGTLTAGATDALKNTTAITVNNGGTLLLAGTGNRINNAAGINLAGGTLNTGGLSEGAVGAANFGLGTLTLSATSTLDFGAGNGSIIEFSGVGPQTANTVLQIVNWDGVGKTGGGTERLLFAGVTADFTNQFTQSEVSFNGLGGYKAIQYTNSGNYYEITAVPEPTTILGGLALVGLVGWRERRKLRALLRRWS